MDLFINLNFSREPGGFDDPVGPNPFCSPTKDGRWLLTPEGVDFVKALFLAAQKAAEANSVSRLPRELLYMILAMMRIKDTDFGDHGGPGLFPLEMERQRKGWGPIYCAYRRTGCMSCRGMGKGALLPPVPLLLVLTPVPVDPVLARLERLFTANPFACSRSMAKKAAWDHYIAQKRSAAFPPLVDPGKMLLLPNQDFLAFDRSDCRLKQIRREGKTGHFYVVAVYGNGPGYDNAATVGPDESHFTRVERMTVSPCGQIVVFIDHGEDFTGHYPGIHPEIVGDAIRNGVLRTHVRCLYLRTGRVETVNRPIAIEGSEVTFDRHVIPTFSVAGVTLIDGNTSDWGQTAKCLVTLQDGSVLVGGKCLHVLRFRKAGKAVRLLEVDHRVELDVRRQATVYDDYIRNGFYLADPVGCNGDDACDIWQMNVFDGGKVLLLIGQQYGKGEQYPLRTLHLGTGAVTVGLPWETGRREDEPAPLAFTERMKQGCGVVYHGIDVASSGTGALVLDAEGILRLDADGSRVVAKRFVFEDAWKPRGLVFMANGEALITREQ